MGGVYFDASGQGYVWRHPFDQATQDQLITADRPQGTLTNSDLEQAGVLGQLGTIAEHLPVAYATIHTCCDNTPAVARFTRGAVTSDRAPAYLCRLASHHQRAHRYCATVSYLPGDLNRMADDASRLQSLTDPAFLAHFDSTYPQGKNWQLRFLPKQLCSDLYSALACKSHPQRTPPKLEPPSRAYSPAGRYSA